MLLLTFIQLCFFSALQVGREGRTLAPTARLVARAVTAFQAVRSKAWRGAPPGPQAWMTLRP
jgi:hypothetical protein